jgi:hypothetical protein
MARIMANGEKNANNGAASIMAKSAANQKWRIRMAA